MCVYMYVCIYIYIHIYILVEISTQINLNHEKVSHMCNFPFVFFYLKMAPIGKTKNVS